MDASEANEQEQQRKCDATSSARAIEDVSALPVGSKSTDTNDPTRCRYHDPQCHGHRAIKPDGSLHFLCDTHRQRERLAQHKNKQRQRLLRALTNALKPEESNEEGPARRRPRLVLLGNRQTLILGVVLAERGQSGSML